MPSLDDVPDRFSSCHHWEALVAWLKAHFFDPYDRKKIASRWARKYHCKITLEMWQMLFPDGTPGHPPTWPVE